MGGRSVKEFDATLNPGGSDPGKNPECDVEFDGVEWRSSCIL